MGRKTFYRLVGGAARTPLGHVNYVELPEDATDIGAFRKAVFHEIEPSLPACVGAPSLEVFTFQCEFERLGVGKSLAGFGLNDDEPLIVQVPQVWRDTGADSVPLTEQNIVQDLREAVFNKVVRALPGMILASHLRVYARDSKKYLDADEIIGEYGKNEKTALIVEVPEISQPVAELMPRRGALGLQRLEQLGDVPPRKKPKKEVVPQLIPHTSPIQAGDFCVPLESIPAFVRIQDGFSRIGPPRPLYMLHGPRQFGKTTIALGVQQWLGSFPDVKCVYIALQADDMANEERFWKTLGRAIRAGSRCYCDSYESFICLVYEVASKEKKTICLVVDELDVLFGNYELARAFLSAIRSLRGNSSFWGFLGVGSHKLVLDHHIAGMLIARRYDFADSLRQGIIGYSCGAPGEFAAMIRFTIDNGKWGLEWADWELWFKWTKFHEYLKKHNEAYERTRKQLADLDPSRWAALECVLQHNGALTADEVEVMCGVHHTRRNEKLVDKLLQ